MRSAATNSRSFECSGHSSPSALKRFNDAAVEAVNALEAGGRRSFLRAQIFLRQNGFPEVPLDGQPSEDLRKAIQACMALNSCFEKVSGSL